MALTIGFDDILVLYSLSVGQCVRRIRSHAIADDPLLQPLIDRRDRARDQFASLGDLRRGTLAAN